MTQAESEGVLSPHQEARLRESIGRQTLLTTLGVSIAELAPGRVVLELPFRDDLCQQNGFMHAGAITSCADSACGYAAMTLQPEDRDILTVEFKVNLMSPAVGRLFRATATVVRAGRTLTVCSAEVVADTAAEAGAQRHAFPSLSPSAERRGASTQPRKPVALMQATLMAVPTA